MNIVKIKFSFFFLVLFSLTHIAKGSGLKNTAHFTKEENDQFRVYCLNGNIETIQKDDFVTGRFCEELEHNSPFSDLTYNGYNIFFAKCKNQDFTFVTLTKDLSNPNLCTHMATIEFNHPCDVIKMQIPNFRKLSEQSWETLLNFGEEYFKIFMNNKSINNFETAECEGLKKHYTEHMDLVYGTESITTEFFSCNQNRDDIPREKIVENNKPYIYDFMNYKNLKFYACNLMKNLCTSSNNPCDLEDLKKFEL